MSPCPTCGRPLSAAETFCPRCADPETTRMASGRRGAGAAWPSPEAAQGPPPLPPQPGGQQPSAWGQQQYGQQQYGQHQQLPPTQYGQPSPFGQPLPPAPPRGPSGRGRLLAYVGGGAAMLLVVGLGAWAVTGLGGDEGEPSAEPASSATPAAEGSTTPTPTDPPSAEESTEPSPTAPDTADEDQVGDGAGDGAGDAGSATYDLSNGSQSVDLTIVADAPTTITATPDTPEDIVLTVLGPRGAEACRSDASFTDPESCTLRNPQVGGVYEVVVAMYGDVPGGTGVVETS